MIWSNLNRYRRLSLETPNKPFGSQRKGLAKLQTNGKALIPFVVSRKLTGWSGHGLNQLARRHPLPLSLL